MAENILPGAAGHIKVTLLSFEHNLMYVRKGKFNETFALWSNCPAKGQIRFLLSAERSVLRASLPLPVRLSASPYGHFAALPHAPSPTSCIVCLNTVPQCVSGAKEMKTFYGFALCRANAIPIRSEIQRRIV